VTVWEILGITLAGGAAGFVNSLAGSGTLITFPTLLAFGVPPVTANVSNNIGLVPGSAAGVLGWRRELEGQRARVLRLAPASLVGGISGAVLLLALPSSAFKAIVPVLIATGVLLVALQPLLLSRASEPRLKRGDAWWLWPGVAFAGVYGGYFGAAQGILLMGLLGVGTSDTVHRDNALKNVLATLVNAVAALIFIFAADVDWLIVALIAVGSIVGAQVGAKVGRRMPAYILRTFIVVVGLTALAVFLLR
jgi:uncharacterized membrane protein YfcA